MDVSDEWLALFADPARCCSSSGNLVASCVHTAYSFLFLALGMNHSGDIAGVGGSDVGAIL